MFKNFNKEIVVKTSLKKMLIESVVNSVVWTGVIYLILTVFVDDISNILKIIVDGKIQAIEIVLLLLPIILILNVCISLGTGIILLDKKKKSKSK